MNIKKISTTSQSLSSKIKIEERQRKIAKKIAEEKRFSGFIQKTAQALLGNRCYDLNISTVDKYVPTTEKIFGYSGKLSVSNSDWAPWSYIGRMLDK